MATFLRRRLPERPTSDLGRNEALWGYLFIAAPLIGFVIFQVIPLVISLVISMTEWNLLTSPEWVGLDNWRNVLGVSVVHVPPMVDESTGEALWRCGRETVVESRIGEFAEATDPRGRPVTCEPRLVTASEVLPPRYETWTSFNLFGRNYVIGARDPVLWTAMFNTMFMLLGIPISMVIALTLAIALNQGIHGQKFFRAVYYMPTILPLAAIVLVWTWIYNPDFGLLNYMLKGLGLPPSLSAINWLQDASAVKPALMIIGIWGGVGYQMVIYLAGIQGIPRQLYEAAEIDGAGAWARFRYITWPGLTPTTFFLFVTALIGGFQVFLQPYLMTGGGPGSASTTAVQLIWQNAFRDLQMGYAASQAWLLGAIIMTITVANFLLARRWVFYE